ncbi:MAG: hypothetical protein ACXVC1_05365 [Tumebacillaceae bacterium]
MVISIMLVLNLIVLYSFLVSKKHLHLFEIMVLWMTFTFLRMDYNAVLSLNLGLLTNSQKLSYIWAMYFDRQMLFPIPQVWYVSAYSGAHSLARKIVLFVIVVALLTGLSYLAVTSGMVSFTKWRIWWEAIYWVCSLFVGIGLMHWFRKFLYKEVNC